MKSLATRVVLDQLNHHDQLDTVKIELNSTLIINNKYYVNYFFEEKEEEPSTSEKTSTVCDLGSVDSDEGNGAKMRPYISDIYFRSIKSLRRRRGD